LPLYSGFEKLFHYKCCETGLNLSQSCHRPAAILGMKPAPAALPSLWRAQASALGGEVLDDQREQGKGGVSFN
jgi:hypothetical protein